MKYEEEIATYLHQKNAISQENYDLLVNKISTQKFSLNWELRTLLYIGVTLFTSGLGIIIYKNIGELGHIALIILLFGTCFLTYGYIFKNAQPFSKLQVNHSNPFYDYAVLLASLLLISAIGYLQFKYALLGNFASYSALIISLILFATAFKFDHKGVLTLAITFHASFFGLVVTPMNFFDNFSDDNSQIILHTALGVGLLFYAYTFIIKHTAIKVHFSIFFTICLQYFSFGSFNRCFYSTYCVCLLPNFVGR